jgi:hypothetical protein
LAKVRRTHGVTTAGLKPFLAAEGGIQSFDARRREGVDSDANAVPAPVAIETDFVEVNH